MLHNRYRNKKQMVSEGTHKHRTPLPTVKRDVIHVVKV